MTASPHLYESPLGLYGFQARAVGRAYVSPDLLACMDAGLGKTHLGMATAAILFEDGLIDGVIVVAEMNKIRDWCRDFEAFTKLSVALYHGDRAKRAKLRALPPQVLVSTFETWRNDMAHPNTALKHPSQGNWLPGPLVEAWAGRRLLVIYDEITKVRERTNGLYKAQAAFLAAMRKTAPTRTMGLTATPIESSPMNVFNIGRLLVPDRMGTVDDFIRDHVVAKDLFGNPCKFKNIGVNDTVREPGVPTLREKFGDTIVVKRKSDDDVKDEFPKQVEEFEAINLGARHLAFYRTVQEAFYDLNPSPMEERMLFGVLRQIAGHPLALLRSEGKLAQAIVGQVGEEGLRALGSAKADYLVSRLDRVVRIQQAKGVVFTFFGQSILPILYDRLKDEGYRVVMNHGKMSSQRRQESIDALRFGDAQIFLSSDAGSRGLNLPEAHYVWNYESPLTYANYRQRSDRVHRIDSLAEIVVTETLIANDTVEEPIADLVIRRNRWHDVFLDDEDGEGEHLSAEERRAMIRFAQKKSRAA